LHPFVYAASNTNAAAKFFGAGTAFACNRCKHFCGLNVRVCVEKHIAFLWIVLPNFVFVFVPKGVLERGAPNCAPIEKKKKG
jgi:hypothetical protein